MADYLVEDTMSGRRDWVTAENMVAALITRENELRGVGKETGRVPGHPHYGMPRLPENTNISYGLELREGRGAFVDASIGAVRIRGPLADVMRSSLQSFSIPHDVMERLTSIRNELFAASLHIIHHGAIHVGTPQSQRLNAAYKLIAEMLVGGPPATTPPDYPTPHADSPGGSRWPTLNARS